MSSHLEQLIQANKHKSNPNMKVSIITVCYNSESTIESTIQSVIQQSYPNIEYIVVDGDSTDGTFKIIKKYEKHITKYIKEKDHGIYDAINKGIKLATGDILGILNSDDVYCNLDTIKHVVEKFAKEQKDALYGDLKYVQSDNLSKTIRYWKSGPFRSIKFLFGWMPPHPTFFLKRTIYQNLGNYTTSFKSAADYELMLRMLFRYNVSVSYLPEVMVLMRTGGVSNASVKNRIKANLEDKKAWIINGLESFFFTHWLKPIRKIPQYLLHY